MRNDAGINGDAQRIEQIAWMLFLKIYDEKENDWEFNEDNYVSFIPEECRWRNWAHDEGDGEALTAEDLLDFVDNTLFPTLKSLEVTPTTPMRSAIVRATFEDANQYMKDGVLLRQVINVIDDLDLSSYEESHAFGEIYETILKEMQSAGSAGEFYTPRALTDFMAEIIQPQIGEKMADFACGTGGFLTSWLKVLDTKVFPDSDSEVQYNPKALLVNFERGDYTIPYHSYSYSKPDSDRVNWYSNEYGTINFRIDNGKINIIDQHRSEKFSSSTGVEADRCVYVGNNIYLLGMYYDSAEAAIDSVEYK